MRPASTSSTRSSAPSAAMALPSCRRTSPAPGGLPARYTHTPFETAHLGDIEALAEWMCAFVRKGVGE